MGKAGRPPKPKSQQTKQIHLNSYNSTDLSETDDVPKNVICKLPTAIKCSDFTIHCNSHYIINDSNTAINVCDFVEIKYEVDEDQSSTEIARVICIFRFEN